MGVEAASAALQVQGGMGFIEETGAAQYYRDARILPIYEGTNGIQAIDLMGRKLALGKGAAVRELVERHLPDRRRAEERRRRLAAHDRRAPRGRVWRPCSRPPAG